jgi:uncharacterized protein (DUF2249 family)
VANFADHIPKSESGSFAANSEGDFEWEKLSVGCW